MSMESSFTIAGACCFMNPRLLPNGNRGKIEIADHPFRQTFMEQRSWVDIGSITAPGAPKGAIQDAYFI
jgi:hypothetical protein